MNLVITKTLLGSDATLGKETTLADLWKVSSVLNTKLRRLDLWELGS